MPSAPFVAGAAVDLVVRRHCGDAVVGVVAFRIERRAGDVGFSNRPARASRALLTISMPLES
jgi:hypothetical protein